MKEYDLSAVFMEADLKYEYKMITSLEPNHMYPEGATKEQWEDFFKRWNEFADKYPESKLKDYEGS